MLFTSLRSCAQPPRGPILHILGSVIVLIFPFLMDIDRSSKTGEKGDSLRFGNEEGILTCGSVDGVFRVYTGHTKYTPTDPLYM